MYADADFAELWNANMKEQDPSRVKSRSGWVILLANCPLLWASKLQTEIACSTMEAEFIALSSAMRDLIPARDILQGVCKALNIPVPEGAKLKSTIFEDNMGCLQLATVPKMTPRSKHIAVKYFWFRSKVGPEHGIQIVKCNTKDMLADIFTKGLTYDTFTTLRSTLMGWTLSREGVSQRVSHNDSHGTINRQKRVRFSLALNRYHSIPARSNRDSTTLIGNKQFETVESDVSRTRQDL